MSHLRFHTPHAHLAPPFGSDTFGRMAEWFARAFGTPQFLLAQTAIVLAWVALNSIRAADFDPYPFILLNLAFSFQAAYAAPLILLAETRQADREHARTEADALHREEISSVTIALLRHNTELTEQVAELSRRINQLTEEIHANVLGSSPGRSSGA